MNGPLPTGAVFTLPDSTLDFSTIATPLNPPRLASRFGVGALSVTTTVAGSGPVTDLTVANLYALFSFSLMIRSKE